jgi:hypothetical protein
MKKKTKFSQENNFVLKKEKRKRSYEKKRHFSKHEKQHNTLKRKNN